MSKNGNIYALIYEIVRQIPYGKVTSYGAIAKCIGIGRSARLVGWALKSSQGIDIPAHRVLNRLGMLTGKHQFPGTHLMQELLESEGQIIESDKVLNFKAVFWDPQEALNLPDDRN